MRTTATQQTTPSPHLAWRCATRWWLSQAKLQNMTTLCALVFTGSRAAACLCTWRPVAATPATRGLRRSQLQGAAATSYFGSEAPSSGTSPGPASRVSRPPSNAQRSGAVLGCCAGAARRLCARGSVAGAPHCCMQAGHTAPFLLASLPASCLTRRSAPRRSCSAGAERARGVRCSWEVRGARCARMQKRRTYLFLELACKRVPFCAAACVLAALLRHEHGAAVS